MSQIISIQKAQLKKEAQKAVLAHRERLLALTKTELLEEMVQFQNRQSLADPMPAENLYWGRALFERIEEVAETRELQILSRSFLRQLDYVQERMA